MTPILICIPLKIKSCVYSNAITLQRGQQAPNKSPPIRTGTQQQTALQARVSTTARDVEEYYKD